MNLKMGKYPIALADKVTLFPAVGLEYALVVSGKMKEGPRTYKLGQTGSPDAGDFSALWVKFGGGLDYSFNDRTFIRSELLYGIRFENKYERDYINEFYYDLDYNEDGYLEAVLGHGLTVKVSVGFRL